MRDETTESNGVYESSEFSKKIFELEESIQHDIQQNGVGVDMLNFIEKIKSYKISVTTWNMLYAAPSSMYDVDKYSAYYQEKTDKPQRATPAIDKPQRIK